MEARLWFVCFCEPRRVIPLVEELRRRGEAVECPTQTFVRRRPRSNKTQLFVRPLIGGLFFCAEGSWPLGEGIVGGVELAEIKRLFAFGKPARVSEQELQALRDASEEANRRRLAPQAAPNFVAGESVGVIEGPFAFKEGKTVSGTKRGRVWVQFAGWPIPIQVGRIEPATVADHIVDHKGNEELFWDMSNLQGLCKPCHDGPKRTGRIGVGSDGWPEPVALEAKRDP